MTGKRKYGTGIVAVAWTHVPSDFIGLPIQRENPPFVLLLCYYYTIDECLYGGTDMKPQQFGFQVDLSRCVGCRACEMACDRQHPEMEKGFRHVEPLADGLRARGFLTLGCNHCASPECIRVCPEHCYDKLRNGVVIHHRERCIGCGRCVGACPFEAPRINEQTGKAEKCDFCFERLKEGKQPVCVEICSVGALKMIVLDDDMVDFADYPIVRYTRPSIRFVAARRPKCFWRIKGKETHDE